MKSDISVILAPFKEYEKKIFSIRNEVFVIGQNVPPELEWDGLDSDCTHVLAETDGEFTGTGRIIMDDGHIGRVAVLEKFRGMGVGSAIMNKLIQLGREHGLTRFWLGSQLTAVPFYKTLGFTPYGDEFMDAGIPHIHMEYVTSDT